MKVHVVWLLLGLLLAACAPAGGTGQAPAPQAPAPQAPAPQAQPGAPAMAVETVATGLETLWAIDFAPDGRIFLTERPGRIRIIRNGRLEPEPWATLDVAAFGEAGLLGLALDPEFARSRYVYVAYTYRDASGVRNRLVRMKESEAGRGSVDKVLLEDVPGASNHDGGRVKFGPDGKLYWTMGDASNPALAQDLKSLAGKIIRINSDGSIPADNPFPGSPVYSYGHRNPQGLAWQPGTGRLYATEHGPSGSQSGHDEVNFVQPGKNYGWPAIRGDETQAGMLPPVIHSGAAETWAPGGAAFVTRGPWKGSLLFVGLRGQTLYRLTLDQAEPAKAQKLERLMAGQHGRMRDVAEGPDGSIYLLTSNRDGRGRPAADDDRVLRIVWK